jgi:hypothetical protein
MILLLTASSVARIILIDKLRFRKAKGMSNLKAQ